MTTFADNNNHHTCSNGVECERFSAWMDLQHMLYIILAEIDSTQLRSEIDMAIAIVPTQEVVNILSFEDHQCNM